MTVTVGRNEAVDRAGAYLLQRIGLRSEGTMHGRLRRSVADEAALRAESIEEYVAALCGGRSDLDALVNRITVQESGFFRHPEHFDVLTSNLLHQLGRPVTIWSAACANGQEAYSLAMLLEERAIPGSVVASDLSTAALARTDAGWYSSREVSGISAERRHRHLIRAGSGWQVSPGVRARVRLLEHNLVDELPRHVGGCQVVFCRNVLIYLAPEQSRLFLSRLADALSPGAYLFLGAAESMWQMSDRFQPVHIDDAFVYRRRDPARRTLVTSQAIGDPTSPATPAKGRPALAARVAPKSRRSSGDGRPTGRDVTNPRGLVDTVVQGQGTEDTPALAEAGRLALAAGDHATAIVCFRKWSYLTPDNPMGAFHLGLALEAGGHRRPAQRAYAVARAILAGAGNDAVDQALEGFAREELHKLLDAKQGPYR